MSKEPSASRTHLGMTSSDCSQGDEPAEEDVCSSKLSQINTTIQPYNSPFSVDLYHEPISDCHDDTMSDDSDGVDSYENQTEVDKDSGLRSSSKLTVRFQDNGDEERSFSETEADRYSKPGTGDDTQYLSLSNLSSISNSSAHLAESSEPEDQKGERVTRLKNRTKSRLRLSSASTRNTSSEDDQKKASQLTRRPQSCSPYRHNLQLTFNDYQNRYGSAEDLNLSETDKKILEIWLWRYEKERLEEENARQKTYAWMLEKEKARDKFLEGEKRHWKDIEKKRRLENAVTQKLYEHRMKKMEEEKMSLQQYLEKKESASKRKLRSITRSRNKLLEEKGRLEDERRQAAINRIKKEEELDRKEKVDALNKKLEKLRIAEDRRTAVYDACRERLSQLRIYEEADHSARVLRLQMNYSKMVESMKADIAEKHAKAESKYNSVQKQKLEGRKKQRQIENSRTRRAQEMVAELDRGMNQWRQEVLKMQKLAIEKAEARATSMLMARKNGLSRHLKEKDLQHSENMKRIELQERERLQKTREKIKEKLFRHSRFQEQRLEVLNDNKKMALIGADLRSFILEKIHPEGFDRVSQMELHLKTLIRLPKYSDSCHRSCQCVG